MENADEIKALIEDVQNAMEDPFARFVILNVFRVRKLVKIMTFGRWCRI